jgi:hypothetical protein
MHVRTLLLPLLVLCLLVSPAGADVIHLKDGRRFEGTVKQETKVQVVFTTDFGDMTFKRAEISKIERGQTLRQQFDSRFRSAKTAADFFELGLWAEKNKQRALARRAMRKAKELEPNHDGANGWLGLVKYKGQWMTTEEQAALLRKEHEADMLKRGLVRHGDEWVTVAQKQKLDAGLVYHEGRWMSPEDKRRAEGFILVDGQWVAAHVAIATQHMTEVLGIADTVGEVVLGPDVAVAGPFERSFLEPIVAGLGVGRAWFDAHFAAPPGIALLGGRAAEFYVWGRDGAHYTNTVDHLAKLTDTVPEGWAEAVAKIHGFVYWDPFCISSARAKGRPLEDLAGHCFHHWGHLLLNRHRYDGRLLPPWFDEGYASLFEFRTHRRNAVFCLGKPAAIVTETGGRTKARRKTVEYVFDSKLFRRGTWRETLAGALRDGQTKMQSFDELARKQFGELTLLDIAMGMGICLWLEGQEGALERFHAALRKDAPKAPQRVLFSTGPRQARYDRAFQAAVGMDWRAADRAWRAWFLGAIEQEGPKPKRRR